MCRPVATFQVFVHALNSRMLVIPERPGNRRTDSLRNVIETGAAGLLFLIPGLGETLRPRLRDSR